jgi:predicted enzyme related to lactoylglutathione lyase
MAARQLNAKLIICSIPTKNSAAAQKFYDTLLGGQDFARSLNDRFESYYRPISQDGLTLSISARRDDREPITCFFAVDDLDATVSQLETAGGKLVVKPSAVPISGPPEAKRVFDDSIGKAQGQPSITAGRFATMLDPDGNYLGLMELDDSVKFLYNAGPEYRMLSQDQVDQHENWLRRGAPLMPDHPGTS